MSDAADFAQTTAQNEHVDDDGTWAFEGSPAFRSEAVGNEEDEDAIVPRKRVHQETPNAENTSGHDQDGDEGVFGRQDEDEARQSAPVKKKKKKAHGDTSAAVDVSNDGDESQTLPEQERRRQEMLRKIDMAAKGPKRRPKKKADETDLEQAADDEVVRMRDTMQAAAIEDRVANEEKRPATSKLRMLREVVETLQKTGFQQAILDNNLLEAVRMWLEPLPDKSLPSLNIQRALFPLLDRMYIDSTSLKMSGLGKLVLFYTRCQRVDKGIARIADRLMGKLYIQLIRILCSFLVEESWSRPILKRSSSYRDRQQAVRQYHADPSRAMQRALQDSERAAKVPDSQRTRIPEAVTGNAFRYAPVSAINDAMDDSQMAKVIERQRINKFKRSMVNSKR